MSGRELLSIGKYTNKSENIMFSYEYEPYYNFTDMWKLFVIIGAFSGGFLVLYFCLCVGFSCKKNNQIKIEDN